MISTEKKVIDANTYEFISDLVRTRSAIVVEAGKEYLLDARLAPIVRELGLSGLNELVSELKKPTSQHLTRRVIDAMTTNETSFFRDVIPFQALQSTVLPAVIRERSSEREICIWSNACSSGQEPYTIAMIVKEHFPVLDGWKVRIIATDLSPSMLDRAKSGLFNQTEINRGLAPQLAAKYFVKEGVQYRIRDDLRKMIEFRELNLVDPFPANLPTMDIVFLRNVLIYFSPETKSNILNRVRTMMRMGGTLFLGGAESTMSLNVPFERTQIDKAVCYRAC